MDSAGRLVSQSNAGKAELEQVDMACSPANYVQEWKKGQQVSPGLKPFERRNVEGRRVAG